VADDVLSAFLLTALDQTDHGVDVRKVVPRLRDLGLVGNDHTADLGTLLLQRLDKKWIGHAAFKPKPAHGHQSSNWVRLLHNAELLNGEIFTTLKEAQILIEGWRQRPHSSFGYKPPAPEVVARPALPAVEGTRPAIALRPLLN
jgi:hypothetical protein